MQLTRDLFAIAKFLLSYGIVRSGDKQTDRTHTQTDADERLIYVTTAA